MEYRFYLFDLDRTLWDFDTNSFNTISSLLLYYFKDRVDPTTFYNYYDKVNRELWVEYERGAISKKELTSSRFPKVFNYFKIGDTLIAERFAEQYLEQMSLQKVLMPHASEVLEKLSKKGAKMAVVTNGFVEGQYKKMVSAGIDHFFDAVVTSEEVGLFKPSPPIFKRALEAIGGVKSETLMVGDDFINDIEGAMIFGIDQFFYNYKGLKGFHGATYSDSDLRALLLSPPQRDLHPPL